MLTDFQNSFASRLSSKFATNSYLNIPPRLKYVATLPCEISTPCSEKSDTLVFPYTSRSFWTNFMKLSANIVSEYVN